VKFRHLLANMPKPSQEDKRKLANKESRLQEMRTLSKMKRDVTIALSSEGFYRTGIMCDIIQVSTSSLYQPASEFQAGCPSSLFYLPARNASPGSGLPSPFPPFAGYARERDGVQIQQSLSSPTRSYSPVVQVLNELFLTLF